MKKMIFFISLALLLVITLLALNVAAASYSANSASSLLKYLSQAQSGDTVYADGQITVSSGFSINNGVALSPDIYSGGSVTLSGGASVLNSGSVSEGALNMGGSSSVVNRGRLELRTIAAGCTVDNYGSLVSAGGLTLNGSLILEKGSAFLLSKSEAVVEESPIYMGLGARLKSDIQKRYSIILPDGSKVSLSGTFDYTVQKTAAPVITLSGSNAQGQRMLTLSCATPNATIYFTVDGSEPNTGSAIYRTPVYVNGSAEIRAIARANNTVISDPSSSSRPSAAAPSPAAPAPAEPPSGQEQPPAGQQLAKSAAPTVSPAAGIYPCRQMIYLTRPGASIYYTTDGSEPTTSSTRYTGPFDIVSSATVKAIAVESGKAPSDTASFRYTLTGFTVDLPDYSDPVGLEAYWQPSVQKISVASPGGVTVEAGDCPYLSNSVMQALYEKGSVSLTIRRSGGDDIVIPAGGALSDFQSDVRVWYSLDSLAALFG